MALARLSVLSCSLFLLGVLFISLIPDHAVLYKSPIPPDAFEASHRYYRAWFDAPLSVKALLHGIVSTGQDSPPAPLSVPKPRPPSPSPPLYTSP
jgi:ER membrane protein SH3